MEDVKSAIPVPSLVKGFPVVGFVEVFQQTPFAVMDPPPALIVVPPPDAVVDAILVMTGDLLGNGIQV